MGGLRSNEEDGIEVEKEEARFELVASGNKGDGSIDDGCIPESLSAIPSAGE